MVAADPDYFRTVIAAGGQDAASITLPVHCPERRFQLAGSQMQVGRRSKSRGLHPEIDLSGPPEDPGVSHLHAVLLAQPDGGWAIVDLGSTNGTTINENPEPLRVGVSVPLADGDRIHIGAWTTITVRAP
jgi:pSer/pThr/pTyr-binding forkhead associated (FHA) protein